MSIKSALLKQLDQEKMHSFTIFSVEKAVCIAGRTCTQVDEKFRN